MREKAKVDEKNREMSSTIERLKRKNAASEEQEGMLRIRLHKLKRALDACGVTDEDLEKQLQRIVDKNRELEQLLEQMRTEHGDAKTAEKMLLGELETTRRTERERTATETELKRQLAKAHEDYNTLSQKTLSEIDRLEGEMKRMNEDASELRKVNLQLTNGERQRTTELTAVKTEANENVRRIALLQQEICTLQIDLQTKEEACVKLRKDSDELIEKSVPKERLEEVLAELKQMRKAVQESEITIQKLQNEQCVFQGKAEEKKTRT